MSAARIRARTVAISGEILLEGQRANFQARVNGPRVDAEFEQHPESERPLDQWELFRALERWIDENMRG